jgi:hypothetical protein
MLDGEEPKAEVLDLLMEVFGLRGGLGYSYRGKLVTGSYLIMWIEEITYGY